MHQVLWQRLVGSLPADTGESDAESELLEGSSDPVQVIQYDDGPELVLSEVRELERYLQQNSSEDIMRKRQIRMALRALDGEYVRWPYDHVQVRSAS